MSPNVRAQKSHRGITSILTRLMVPIFLFCFPLVAHAETCDELLTRAKVLAASLRVTVEASKSVVVGSPIQIRWQGAALQATSTPGVQVTPDDAKDSMVIHPYLVFSAPSDVRLSGVHFFALTAGAQAPLGLNYEKNRTRIFFPVLRSGAASPSGEFTVTPYSRGRQSVRWAIVLAGSCGEQVVPGSNKTVEVLNGSPELVIQEKFSSDVPMRRIRSRTGSYDLLVFKDRYEVHDSQTDDKILDYAGINPNFSPNGRFVVSERVTDNYLEVIDLASRQRIAELSYGLLAWARNDSYFVHGSADWAAVAIQNAIVDRPPEIESGPLSCHACRAWDDAQVVIDLDREFTAALGKWESVVGGLIGDKSTGFEQEKMDGDHSDALRYISQTFYKDYQPPKTWSLGERIMLSHRSDDGPQNKFLVLHTTIDGASGIPTRTETSDLIGRGLVYRDLEVNRTRTQLNSVDSMRAQLSELGVPTQPSKVLEHLFAFDGDYEKPMGLKNPQLASIIQEIRLRVPSTAPLFEKDWISCAEPNLTPDHISDIWHFTQSGHEFWLLQSICAEGSAGFHYSHQFLVRTTGSDPIVALDLPIRGVSRMGGLYDALRIRPILLSDTTLGMILVESQEIALVGLQDGKLLVPLIEISRAQLFADAGLVRDQRYLLQLNQDGEISIYRLSDGHKMLSGAYVDGEIVFMNEQGYYDTTYEGAHAVQVHFPGIGHLYIFNQFEKVLRRPGIASATLDNNGAPLALPLISAPPTVHFSLSAIPQNGARTGKVSVVGDNELSEVRFYFDGRLIDRRSLQGLRAQFTITLPDPGGARWISAVASDSKGLVSASSAVHIPGTPAPHGTLRTINVGVDTYADSHFPTLRFGKADAKHLAQAMESTKGHAFRAVVTKLLLDSEVTPESVIDTIREAANATLPDDMLLISFAGHAVDGASIGQPGVGLMIATSVSRLQNIAETSIPWSKLADAVATIKGRVVFVLDVCHSGIAGSEGFATNEDAVTSLFTKTGAPMVVLAASKGRQLSQESPKSGGGLFTSALVDAITESRSITDRDRSGLIDLGELYSATKKKVMEQSGGEQTPWLARNGLVGEMSMF
jgi:uncharacterized caspase-like protein